jgi:hydroxymethyl cephem carbamoyltransferase
MLIVAVKPDHDGAIAVIKDHTLLFSVEAEKDSGYRHAALTPTTILNVAERVGEAPDVIALGGWWDGGYIYTGAGYWGLEVVEQSLNLFGKRVKFFSSSHERSHIMMGIGMAPKDESPLRAVLVYEGNVGSFYLVDENWRVVRTIPVMVAPGTRWAFLFALADPTFPDRAPGPRIEDSGKLMALAAYGDPNEADSQITDTVERILANRDQGLWHPDVKHTFRDSPVYNAGVEAAVTKIAAALLMKRIFEVFSEAAREHLPQGIPLHISGGCGLNCDWNVGWRELGHFSSVFVPPCTDDSGSALGTAIDALTAETGDPYINWNVYSGLDFVWDRDPDPAKWQKRALDHKALAEALARGRLAAWVQGRWEIGPRALGNRSILAEPFDVRTRDRLNEVKEREGYRPIAPCCRIEDAAKVFDDGSEDPYMLYFRQFLTEDFGAVRHVDGSARAQIVTKESNKRLHELLSVVAAQQGAGVLCNTSLNFKHVGFINRMSHLAQYCETREIPEMVIGDAWFRRV